MTSEGLSKKDPIAMLEVCEYISTQDKRSSRLNFFNDLLETETNYEDSTLNFPASYKKYSMPNYMEQERKNIPSALKKGNFNLQNPDESPQKPKPPSNDPDKKL